MQKTKSCLVLVFTILLLGSFFGLQNAYSQTVSNEGKSTYVHATITPSSVEAKVGDSFKITVKVAVQQGGFTVNHKLPKFLDLIDGKKSHSGNMPNQPMSGLSEQTFTQQNTLLCKNDGIGNYEVIILDKLTNKKFTIKSLVSCESQSDASQVADDNVVSTGKISNPQQTSQGGLVSAYFEQSSISADVGSNIDAKLHVTVNADLSSATGSYQYKKGHPLNYLSGQDVLPKAKTSTTYHHIFNCVEKGKDVPSYTITVTDKGGFLGWGKKSDTLTVKFDAECKRDESRSHDPNRGSFVRSGDVYAPDEPEIIDEDVIKETKTLRNDIKTPSDETKRLKNTLEKMLDPTKNPLMKKPADKITQKDKTKQADKAKLGDKLKANSTGDIVIDEDGVVTFPDGAKFYPGGLITYPDGKSIYIGNLFDEAKQADKAKPGDRPESSDNKQTNSCKGCPKPGSDGTTPISGGPIKLPDNTLIYPDGRVVLPDGTTIDTDGVIHTTDGRVIYPDGTVVYPNGVRISPDGKISTPVAPPPLIDPDAPIIPKGQPVPPSILDDLGPQKTPLANLQKNVDDAALTKQINILTKQVDDLNAELKKAKDALAAQVAQENKANQIVAIQQDKVDTAKETVQNPILTDKQQKRLIWEAMVTEWREVHLNKIPQKQNEIGTLADSAEGQEYYNKINSINSDINYYKTQQNNGQGSVMVTIWDVNRTQQMQITVNEAVTYYTNALANYKANSPVGIKMAKLESEMADLTKLDLALNQKQQDYLTANNLGELIYGTIQKEIDDMKNTAKGVVIVETGKLNDAQTVLDKEKSETKTAQNEITVLQNRMAETIVTLDTTKKMLDPANRATTMFKDGKVVMPPTTPPKSTKTEPTKPKTSTPMFSDPVVTERKDKNGKVIETEILYPDNTKVVILVDPNTGLKIEITFDKDGNKKHEVHTDPKRGKVLEIRYTSTETITTEYHQDGTKTTKATPTAKK